MEESLESLRKRTHQHFVLNLRKDVVNTAFGNPENIRQGFERVIGTAGMMSGLPFASFCEVKLKDSGPVASIQIGTKTIFSVDSWIGGGPYELQRLARLLMVYPIRLFGDEEAIRWLQLVDHRDSKLAQAALAALNDPTGYQSLSKILGRLVEERVPLTDFSAILQTIADKGSVPAGDDAHWSLVEDIRSAIRESAAANYTHQLMYGVQQRFDVDSELLRGLNDPAAFAAIDKSLCYALGELNRAPVIVVREAGARRKLWERIEALLTAGRIPKPAFVLKLSELPQTEALPDTTDEIRPVGMAGD